LAKLFYFFDSIPQNDIKLMYFEIKFQEILNNFELNMPFTKYLIENHLFMK